MAIIIDDHLTQMSTASAQGSNQSGLNRVDGWPETSYLNIDSKVVG